MSSAAPNPGIIFETLTAYQRTAALKAAIDLELFAEMAKGSDTPRRRSPKESLPHRAEFASCATF
jgi:hypothetical protein